jgi:hypothetical protein
MNVSVSIDWLNETQATIQRLQQENDELRRQLQQAQQEEEDVVEAPEPVAQTTRRITIKWTKKDHFLAMMAYKKLIDDDVFLNSDPKWATKPDKGKYTLDRKKKAFEWYFTGGLRGLGGGGDGAKGMTEEVFRAYGRLTDEALNGIYETSLNQL